MSQTLEADTSSTTVRAIPPDCLEGYERGWALVRGKDGLASFRARVHHEGMAVVTEYRTRNYAHSREDDAIVQQWFVSLIQKLPQLMHE